jgi:Fe-S-cluster containining protein
MNSPSALTTSDSETLPSWVAAACNGCGKCCLNSGYMGSLTASKEDVRRWKKEERYDILKYVTEIFPGLYDLWVKDGEESSRCPFVRKRPNQQTYRCTIYETRPEVCRLYPQSAHQMTEIDCEIIPAILKVSDSLKGEK